MGKEFAVTKRDLIELVSDRVGHPHNEVAAVVQSTLDAIVQSLADGQRIEIRNFGVFEVKKRDARMGRNPRSGEEVPVPEKRVASFRPGRALKELIQSSPPETFGEQQQERPETAPGAEPQTNAPGDHFRNPVS